MPPAVTTIPSWDAAPGDDGRHPADRRIDTIEAREAINQLVALGYIEKPEENRQQAIEKTVRELDYNLAGDYIEANRHADAAAILQRLQGKWPDEYRFGIQLASCCQALGRTGEARRLLEDLFARKEKNAAAAREKIEELAEKHKDKKPEDLSEAEQEELRDLQSEGLVEPVRRRVPDGFAALRRRRRRGGLAALERRGAV